MAHKFKNHSQRKAVMAKLKNLSFINQRKVIHEIRQQRLENRICPKCGRGLKGDALLCERCNKASNILLSGQTRNIKPSEIKKAKMSITRFG